MSETFLTRDEVAELTGRKNKRLQAEHLRKLGLPFWINAAGAAVVPRSAIEGTRTPAPATKPKWEPSVLRKLACG
ncbi:DUF4224 domain-containing protein [Massilia sp. RP-1-19]|uniref:DUF4224 domain-containing protein n=1 Tax=Massilia polaris TaxID=2728846 RepID=A0A848HPQ9_9BURK|nr:DUF4224 domain-containing protein [Massilia polaris]NML61791.1 DUF4224 domain-containing protein [Massilia polaris]